jgi:TatD DNase family protein
MLIDTHCHLNMMVRGHEIKNRALSLTKNEITLCADFINEASNQGVSIIINVGTNLLESKISIEIAQLSPNVFATIGLHPTDAETNSWKEVIKEFRDLLNSHENKIVGIGECGIDRYHHYDAQLQEAVFKAQIELALEHDLALVIHSREAAEETLKILDEYKNESNFRGTMHCYSYGIDYARDIIKMNLVLGLGGTITYKKNDFLRQVAQEMPLSKIILETDAPFLAPQDFRGKPNKPAFIKNIAEFLAELRNESFEIIATQTTNNALQLFKIQKPA